MVLLLVFASEVSLHFFVPAKHLNHIELAVLVSVYVGGFTRQLIDLIKSFIIYLSPPFCHNIKKNILKRFRCKNDKRKEIFIDHSRTKITNWNAEQNRCNKEGKLLRQTD